MTAAVRLYLVPYGRFESPTVKLPRHRERHGLLEPEFKQGFAGDLKLFAFLGSSDGCPGASAG
jgi:hypothetical protein